MDEEKCVVYWLQAQIVLIIRSDNDLFNKSHLLKSDSQTVDFFVKKLDISYLKPCFMQKYVVLVLTFTLSILFIG